MMLFQKNKKERSNMVTLEKIQEAKSCIQDSVRKTPVLNCKKLGAQTGNDVYLKLEN